MSAVEILKNIVLGLLSPIWIVLLILGLFVWFMFVGIPDLVCDLGDDIKDEFEERFKS